MKTVWAVTSVVGAVLLIAVIAPPADQIRHTGVQLCTAMLGAAPDDHATVENLSGAQAAALAADRHLTGDGAYRFVATLNTIKNWRLLPADQVLDWAANPAAARLPDRAQLDSPWPAPTPDTDPPDPEQEGGTLYEQACATILRRADALTSTTEPVRASTPTATTSNDADLGTSARRAAVVDEVIRHLGAATAESQLWATISPTPHLDAKRTLFTQLAHTAPVAQPSPGDLVCYDFTASGPARCSLVINAGPAPTIAAPDAEETLVAQPMPANRVIIEPVPVNDSDTA